MENLRTEQVWLTENNISTEATNVAVKGRQILVNGNPFFIKGVGYSPIPIGVNPEVNFRCLECRSSCRS